jgi:hypothetical protein
MRWLTALVSLAMFVAPGVHGQNSQNAFPTGKVESGKFVVEYVYNYTVRPYDPAVTFNAVPRKDASRATPEDAFIAHFSAMTAKDYDWWLTGWTSESRASIEARNRSMNRNADTWAGIWDKAMKGQSIRMTRRVDSGPFAFIVYRMVDAGGKTTLESMYACKRVGKEWLATEELAEDPMFHHFLEGQRHVTLNVR